MLLTENSKIVQTLKHIVKNYDYLEFDEDRSNDDVLSIKVIMSNTKRDLGCCEIIRQELENSTNLSFFISDNVSSEEETCVNGENYFTLRPRITSNPEKCGGKPCIRGMRIRVSDVLDLLANGLTFKEILAEMPDLNSDDIVACLKYASRRIDPLVIRKTEHPTITV